MQEDGRMTLNKENMTLKRFRAIIAAYGVNPDRWPAAERASAKTYLDKHPDAQTFLGENNRPRTSPGHAKRAPAISARA